MSSGEFDSKQDEDDYDEDGKESDDVLFRYNSADRLEEKLIAEAKSPSSPLVKGMQLDLSFAAASKDTRYSQNISLHLHPYAMQLNIVSYFLPFCAPFITIGKDWISKGVEMAMGSKFQFKRALCWWCLICQMVHREKVNLNWGIL